MATSMTRPSSSSKHTKSPSHSPNPKPSSAISSHLAMVELKSRVIAALSKLSDRDTHQIAAEELERIISTLPSDGVPMVLTSLLHDPSPLAARRESLRLLSLLCSTHPDPASPHLPKIIAHVVRRLKDPASDSSVRDACRDAAASLAALYIRDEATAGSSPVAALFVRPMLETMGEQSKAVQAGAAMCLAGVVESAGEAGRFQKLCPRICKLLSGQGFLAKGALLSVASSLSQVGAITPQGIQPLLQSIRECLDNSDWATRKAAADTLSVLASHSSHLIGDGAASTIAALEACRFDKVKPVRDSMMEALVLWKKVMGKGGDGTSEDPKDGKYGEPTKTDKNYQKRSNPSTGRSELVRDSSSTSPIGDDSVSKEKGSNIPEKTAVLLKKKAPSLTDKELNPEFFQNLETRRSDDLPVEVVLPRRCLQSSHSQFEEEPQLADGDLRGTSKQNKFSRSESNDTNTCVNINYPNTEKRLEPYSKLQDSEGSTRDKRIEQRELGTKDLKARAFDADDRNDIGHKELPALRGNTFRTDGHAVEGSLLTNKGNWLAIQRQLSQLERQQANLMNILQDFMGDSHDSMVTLENRVRGLERIVEEMARDLTLSSGRRSGNVMMGYEGSPGRSPSKYNGFHEYSGPKFGRGNDGRLPFTERFLSSKGVVPWRPTDAEAWDSYSYTSSRNGFMSSRPKDDRFSRIGHDDDHVGSRRAWEKGHGPFRLGEGPSARSVWQASKDEATLEAIRVAGEDNGASRSATRGAVPELDAEALVDDNPEKDNRGPLWASWTRAMDSLHVGDVESAFSEVLSKGNDMLLVKLMDRSGPVVDQLSSDTASDILCVVGQFLLEPSLLDIALSWIQQLVYVVTENGADVVDIPPEGRREILMGLHEASAMEMPEDWEGEPAEQLMMQLASVWGIDLQQLIK